MPGVCLFLPSEYFVSKGSRSYSLGFSLMEVVDSEIQLGYIILVKCTELQMLIYYSQNANYYLFTIECCQFEILSNMACKTVFLLEPKCRLSSKMGLSTSTLTLFFLLAIPTQLLKRFSLLSSSWLGPNLGRSGRHRTGSLHWRTFFHGKYRNQLHLEAAPVSRTRESRLKIV